MPINKELKMQITYSWIDSPMLIDPLGVDLWSLLKSTSQDQNILGIGDDSDEKDMYDYLDHLKVIIKSNGHLLIGTIKGKIVLTCLLKKQNLKTMSHSAELLKGAIDKNCRGKGFLKDAFRNIVDKSKEVGVSQLTLDVREDSPAHKLWRIWGFKSYGVLPDYARYQGKSFRGHYMYQSIEELDARLSKQ